MLFYDSRHGGLATSLADLINADIADWHSCLMQMFILNIAYVGTYGFHWKILKHKICSKNVFIPHVKTLTKCSYTLLMCIIANLGLRAALWPGHMVRYKPLRPRWSTSRILRMSKTFGKIQIRLFLGKILNLSEE